MLETPVEGKRGSSLRNFEGVTKKEKVTEKCGRECPELHQGVREAIKE